MDAVRTGLDLKVERLRQVLEDLTGGALVAYSGGADSALLAFEAGTVLGESCVAVTADSPSLPREELRFAVEFARRHGIRHEVVATSEMENPAFVANDAYRCFHCKDELFKRMEALARGRGIAWMLFGAIADDAGDWRPGMEAARQHAARAPLLEAGFTKADVRERSRQLGLETWDKPSAACLSSRFPVGTPITLEDLGRVEKAERVLREAGFRQCRVRLMDGSARIEVEEGDLPRLMDPALRKAVVEGLRGLDFRFVTLDLEGFRSGSLTQMLREKPHGIRRDT